MAGRTMVLRRLSAAMLGRQDQGLSLDPGPGRVPVTGRVRRATADVLADKPWVHWPRHQR